VSDDDERKKREITIAKQMRDLDGLTRNRLIKNSDNVIDARPRLVRK